MEQETKANGVRNYLTDCGIVTDDVSLIEPLRMSLQCRFSMHCDTNTVTQVTQHYVCSGISLHQTYVEYIHFHADVITA